MLHCFARVIFITSLMALTACSNMSTQSYNNKASMDIGKNNFHNAHYSAAFIQLLPYAVRGYRDAEYAVGYMYYYGKGVGESEEIGSSWLCRAKKHNQQDAILLLQRLPEIDCSNAFVVNQKPVHKQVKHQTKKQPHK
jgi:TPR repeat protein